LSEDRLCLRNRPCFHSPWNRQLFSHLLQCHTCCRPHQHLWRLDCLCTNYIVDGIGFVFGSYSWIIFHTYSYLLYVSISIIVQQYSMHTIHTKLFLIKIVFCCGTMFLLSILHKIFNVVFYKICI